MRAKLGDIFEISSGGTPSKSHPEYYGGDIPWVKTGDLKKEYLYEVEDFITEEGLKNSSAKMYESDTVLIAMYGATIGATSILKMNACTNQACAAFKKNEQVIPEYLYYFLRSQKDKFVKDGVGGAQPNISAGYLKKVEMELPSIDEQRIIVNILDKISNIIVNRNQEMISLDDLIKARFVEMFGDPNINSKKWNECPLSKKLNVLGGYAFKSDQFDEKGGIPVLRIGNINAGYFKSVNMVYWQKDESLERYVMYPGDLVMSLTGTVGKDDYGNVCILNDDYEMYYLNQRNAKLEIKEGIDKYYLSQLLKFEQIKKRLTGISRGVRQANISNKDILNLVVPIPPLELQNQFADFVKQVDKSKLQYHPHTHTCQPNTS